MARRAAGRRGENPVDEKIDLKHAGSEKNGSHQFSGFAHARILKIYVGAEFHPQLPQHQVHQLAEVVGRQHLLVVGDRLVADINVR